MASNPSSNLRDEPAEGEERGLDNLEDSGSLLDSVPDSNEDDDMDLDYESSDCGYSPTEAFDDEEDYDDGDDDDNDAEDEDDEEVEEKEEE